LLRSAMLSTDCAESADCAGVLHLLLHLRVDTVERPTNDVHPLAIAGHATASGWSARRLTNRQKDGSWGQRQEESSRVVDRVSRLITRRPDPRSGLDRVRRLEVVDPVLGGEVVEHQEHIDVVADLVGGLGTSGAGTRRRTASPWRRHGRGPQRRGAPPGSSSRAKTGLNFVLHIAGRRQPVGCAQHDQPAVAGAEPRERAPGPLVVERNDARTLMLQTTCPVEW
jgi:hypothetical protein